MGQPQQHLHNPPNHQPQHVALLNPPNPHNSPGQGASSVSSFISAATVPFGQHPNQVGSPIPPESPFSPGDTTVPLSPSFWTCRQQAEVSAMNRLNFSSPESMLSEASY